jgi:hypothetical protein
MYEASLLGSTYASFGYLMNREDPRFVPALSSLRRPPAHSSPETIGENRNTHNVSFPLRPDAELHPRCLIPGLRALFRSKSGFTRLTGPVAWTIDYCVSKTLGPLSPVLRQGSYGKHLSPGEPVAPRPSTGPPPGQSTTTLMNGGHMDEWGT